MTQSTVSNRIQTLEAALGKKLFLRSRAGTQPTIAGQRFLDHALTLHREWNEARRAVGTAGDVSCQMRLGMQSDVATDHIGRWVSEFRKALPETSFYIEVDYSNQMSSDVLAGELDLAIVFTPRHEPDLHYEAVGELRYRMISTDASRRNEIEVDRYILANYSPAFERAHRQMLPELLTAPVASGQNAAVCGLLTSLGGSAFVLDRSAADLGAHRALSRRGRCGSDRAAGLCRHSRSLPPRPRPPAGRRYCQARFPEAHLRPLMPDDVAGRCRPPRIRGWRSGLPLPRPASTRAPCYGFPDTRLRDRCRRRCRRRPGHTWCRL